MAAITSAQSGLWSAPSTWTGGVVPVLGDKVTIAAGHTVTLDGSITTGDDTTTALTINGVLKASRSVSSALQVRGQIVRAAGGGYDFGQESDPIPAAIDVVLYLNDSATPGANKYTTSMTAGNASSFCRFWGAEKLAHTTVASAGAASGDIFIPLNGDLSTWKVGDTLVFGPTGPNTGATARTISSFSAGGVNLNASLGAASVSGRKVLNCTRNVRIRGATNLSTKFNVNYAAGDADGSIEFGNVEFNFAEQTSGNANVGALGFIGSTTTVSAKKIRKLKNLVFNGVYSISGSTVTTVSGAAFLGLNNCAAGGGIVIDGLYSGAVATASPAVIEMRASAYAKVSNIGVITAIGTSTSSTSSAFSIGGNSLYSVGLDLTGGFVLGGVGLLTGNGGAINLTNVEVDGVNRWTNSRGFIGPDTYKGCTIGQTIGNVYTTAPLILISEVGYTAVFDSCTMPADFLTRAGSNISNAPTDMVITVKNRNNDPTLQERYTRGGKQYRENTVTSRGASSFCMDCWFAANPTTYSFTYSLAAGATLPIRGRVQRNTAFGTTYNPTVTMSGQGLTTQTATVPLASADTWYDYALSITNTNGYATDITITYTAQSANDAAGALVYFAGVYDNPWVSTAREFGYLYVDSPVKTVDPSITVTQATALAYPVTFNHSTQTVTVTGSVTARQIYEAFKASLSQSTVQQTVSTTQANARISTSDGGTTFSTTYGITINTGVTVTGSFATTGTVTLSGTGDVNGTYTDSTGTHVKITAPNLVSGTRVQLWDVAAGTELLNTELTGTGLTYATTWTANKTIRLRCDHIDKLPLEATGTLTSAGLAFLATQDADTVYAANGLDGAAIDASGEFATDYPNIEVDVNDPDGITQPQRLYAWLSYIQNTANGIRNFFKAITAESAVSYVIEDSVVNLKLDNVGSTSVTFTGAFLRNRSGTSIIHPGRPYAINFEPGVPTVAGAVVTPAQMWAYPTRTLTNGQLLLAPGERLVTLNNGKHLAKA